MGYGIEIKGHGDIFQITSASTHTRLYSCQSPVYVSAGGTTDTNSHAAEDLIFAQPCYRTTRTVTPTVTVNGNTVTGRTTETSEVAVGDVLSASASGNVVGNLPHVASIGTSSRTVTVTANVINSTTITTSNASQILVGDVLTATTLASISGTLPHVTNINGNTITVSVAQNFGVDVRPTLTFTRSIITLTNTQTLGTGAVTFRRDEAAGMLSYRTVPFGTEGQRIFRHAAKYVVAKPMTSSLANVYTSNYGLYINRENDNSLLFDSRKFKAGMRMKRIIPSGNMAGGQIWDPTYGNNDNKDPNVYLDGPELDAQTPAGNSSRNRLINRNFSTAGSTGSYRASTNTRDNVIYGNDANITSIENIYIAMGSSFYSTQDLWNRNSVYYDHKGWVTGNRHIYPYPTTNGYPAVLHIGYMRFKANPLQTLHDYMMHSNSRTVLVGEYIP